MDYDEPTYNNGGYISSPQKTQEPVLFWSIILNHKKGSNNSLYVFKVTSQKQRHTIYMGVSLNGGTPKTPQNDHFY